LTVAILTCLAIFIKKKSRSRRLMIYWNYGEAA